MKVKRNYNSFDTLLKQWSDKNPDSFTDYSLGSGHKAFWTCEKGHTWSAVICDRYYGNNCPYCSGKRVTNENCFATLYPDIAKEWAYDKNDKTPNDYTSGSGKKVWWRCSKGHLWQNSIYERVRRGQGCPYCSHHRVIKEESFGSLYPVLAEEWDYGRNKKTPYDYTPGSGQNVWWRCKKCGHSWQAVIHSRTLGCGCPYCAGRKVSCDNSLAVQRPDIAMEWDYDKNDDAPDDYTVSSGHMAWWKCPICGNSWRTKIYNRQRTGCPYCAGRLVSESNSLLSCFPEVASEWDYEKNKKTPAEYTSHSNQVVNWICDKGHRWRTSICLRTRENNPTKCPYCSGVRPIKGETDFASRHPEMLDEWCYELTSFMPDEITEFSTKQAYWKCSEGHIYKTAVGKRSVGCRCPICAGKHKKDYSDRIKKETDT